MDDLLLSVHNIDQIDLNLKSPGGLTDLVQMVLDSDEADLSSANK